MNTPLPNTISLTDLARHGTLLREKMAGGPVFLTKSGKTIGVVMSTELYELMLEKFGESATRNTVSKAN